MKFLFVLLAFTSSFLYSNASQACQPMPRWIGTAIEIEAALSHGELWNELGGGYEVDITGVQKTGELTYKLQVTKGEQSCSVEVVLERDYAKEDIPCGPRYTPKIKSVGKLTCLE